MQKTLVMPWQPLSDDALARLRAGYDSHSLRQLGAVFLTTPYPPVGPWASWMMETLYAETPLRPLSRELVLTALLATHKQPGMLAVHMYWALMEGATPDMVAHTLMLSGTYAGIDVYTVGIRTLNQLFTELEALSTGPADTRTVMQSIVQRFPA